MTNPIARAEAALAEWGQLLDRTNRAIWWMGRCYQAMTVLGAFVIASMLTGHQRNGWAALALELACLVPIRILSWRCDRMHRQMDGLRASIDDALTELAKHGG